MEPSRITPAVLSLVNDQTHVQPYGHGHLVTLPLAFYDDDLITLFVEAANGGVRVSDQGTTAMRLHMAGVDPETPRVAEAWRKSVASLGPDVLTEDDTVVGTWGSVLDLGRLLFAVAEAALRVDQLRWLATDRRPVPFRDRVVKQLTTIARLEEVTPNAAIRQRSGRTRQVTAAVGPDADRRIYVQALSSSNRVEQAEHCYYVFSHADVPRERVLAVAAGSRNSWPPALLSELGETTDIAFFDQRDDVINKLRRRLDLVHAR